MMYDWAVHQNILRHGGRGKQNMLYPTLSTGRADTVTTIHHKGVDPRSTQNMDMQCPSLFSDTHHIPNLFCCSRDKCSDLAPST